MWAPRLPSVSLSYSCATDSSTERDSSVASAGASRGRVSPKERAIASWQASTAPRLTSVDTTAGTSFGAMATAERGRISPSGRPGVVVMAPHRKHLMRMARKLAGR